jgi:phosphatidylglycerophosphatase A
MTKMNPASNDSSVPEATGTKPRVALAIATVFGVGYLPKAPGTFGSVVGVILSSLLAGLGLKIIVLVDEGTFPGLRNQPDLLLIFAAVELVGILAISALGVWSSSVSAGYAMTKDPQYIVIDEVSGQILVILLGLMPLTAPIAPARSDISPAVELVLHMLSWQSVLLGFILFRVFDIWKPWPIRRLEKLPGGWGIMADDWMAGIYAAILLRVALHFNLV